MKITKECGKMDSKNIDNLIKSFDEMPLFLDVTEVSRLLKIGRNSAYNVFNSARFPKIEIAGQYRVRKDDLMDWLQNQKTSKEVK